MYSSSSDQIIERSQFAQLVRQTRACLLSSPEMTPVTSNSEDNHVRIRICGVNTTVCPPDGIPSFEHLNKSATSHSGDAFFLRRIHFDHTNYLGFDQSITATPPPIDMANKQEATALIHCCS